MIKKAWNLRSVANLLLAFAAVCPETRPFLAKYYAASVVLPSDWIAVADIVRTFPTKAAVGSVPACLRRVMPAKFETFDEYQVAKYNKNRRGDQLKVS